MDKGLAGVLAVASVLAAPANAASAPPNVASALRADSYADLLKPIPNALEILKVSSAEAVAQVVPEPLSAETLGNVMEVQYWYHHHHHHHHWGRERWYHHHHHHWYRHHHHHHHHED